MRAADQRDKGLAACVNTVVHSGAVVKGRLSITIQTIIMGLLKEMAASNKSL